MKLNILSRSIDPKLKASQLIRFVVVGILNTSVSYFIYAAFLLSGLGYQLANLFALLVGILFSFKTQGHLVFNNTNNRLLGRFVVSWALIYGCVITLIGQIMNLGLDAYVAGALALPFSVVLSYLAQKYFVFRQATPDKSESGHG